MATWNSRGLRGSTLEELVNRTNEQYREKGLALIQKIPTPITPVRMDKNNRHITLAYFEQKSIISEQYRGSLYASMQKNAARIPFLWPIFIPIRWNLWKPLRSRAVWHFFLFFSAMRICFIILP